jgi:hypothetical protein
VALELSDEEVFGVAPRAEMSDEEVFGPKPKPPGWRDPNWQKLRPGHPVMAPRKRSLAERFEDNSRAGTRDTLGGALGDAAATNFDPGYRRRLQEEQDTYRFYGEADPWYKADGGIPGKAAAGAATLGGVLWGGLKSPEAFLGPGKTAVGRIVGNAAVNAGTDVPVQGLQNASGIREGYDPVQTAGAAALGGITQGGFEAGGVLAREGAKGAGRLAGAAGRKVREWSDAEVFGRFTVVKPPEMSDAEVFGVTARAPPEPSFRVDIEGLERARQQSRIATPQEMRTRIAEIVPGVTFTSGPRSAAKNAEVGGVPNSYHTRGKGQAWDLVPPKGMTTSELAKRLRAAGQWAEVIDEGDHVHVAWGSGSGSPSGAPTDGFGSVPESSFTRIPEDSDSQGFEVDFAADGPTAPPAGSPADGAGARPPGGGDVAGAGAASGRRFIDENHVRLYELGQRALRGEQVDPAEAAALAQDMGGFIDWSDFGLSRRELKTLRTEGRINPQRMVAAAKSFVGDYDAPEGQGPHVSYYDPDKLFDVMQARAERPDTAPTVEPDNAGLSGARARADLPEAGAVVRFTHDGQRLEGTVTPAFKPSGRYIVQGEYGDLYAVDPADMIHTGKMGRWSLPERLDSAALDAVPDVLPRRGRLAAEQPIAGPAPEARRAAIDLSAYGDAIKGSRSGNVVGARASKAAPVGKGSPDYAGQTVSQLAEKLRQALGITQRQGRLTLKGGAVGEFDPRSGLIRTRAAKHAIDHLAHEAGHKLQHMGNPALDAAISQHGPELDKLAYEGANPRHIREEGFAEFFKAYLLNPDEARLRAPNFYDAFEDAIKFDGPQVAADLKAIQTAYKDLLEGAALDVAAASVAFTGRPGKIGQLAQAYAELGPGGLFLRLADEIYRGIWDRKHPFNVWMRDLQSLAKKNIGNRLEIEAAQHPYVLARVADHAFAQGRSDIANGITDADKIDPDGPSLKGIYEQAFGKREPTPDEDRRFASYLIARRMRHEWDRYYRGELENPPDKIEQDKAFHERVVEDAERLYPEWKQAGEMATEWNRRQWKLWFDEGFIGEKTFRTGISQHPDYVPVQRDMSDRNPPGGAGGRARGVGQFAGGADAFVGSQRDIIHPMVSMARRAFEMRAAIARNKVIRSMWEAAQKAGPDYGDLIEQLPAKEWELIKIDAMEALKAVAKAIGLDERDRSSFEVFQTTELEGAIQAELWRQREFSPRKDEAVVFMWKGGEKTPLLLPDGWLGRKLFEAISGLTKDTRALWEEIAAAGANALRLGVTGMPEFAIKTGIRDQMAAAILTDVGFVPYKDTATGLRSELTQDQLAKRYQAAGGLKGGVNVAAVRRPFPRDDAQAKEKLEQIRGGNLPRRMRSRGVRVRDARELLSGLAHLVDIGDTATRIGVFKKALSRAKARGLSDREAVAEARHIAADFFDPSRHGGWPAIQQLARTIPFFNSGLQGPDVLVRTVRHAFAKPETMQDKARFRRAWWALSMLGASTALGATIALAWSDDPDFQNINDQVRATHWPIFKRRNGEWVLYPKSFELGMPSNLMERAIEWLKNKDPRILDRIRKDILNTSVPTRDAPILAVPFQAARNRDRTGKPIVPDHLKGTVDPRYQVNAWTSETAKVLAGNAVSPAILEHYITGFLGTGGRDALRVGDAAISAVRGEPQIKSRAPDLYLTRGFVRRTSRGSDSEENFWKLAAKDGAFERASNTLRLIVREGDDAKVEAYLKQLPEDARTYAVSQVLLGGKLGKAHPVARARAAMGVIGDVRRESRDGTLVGPDNQPIALSPAARRAIDDALDDLALVEAHNAQVAAGVRGWAQKEFMDRKAPLERVRKASPAAAKALELRMAQEGVLPIGAAAQMWDTILEAANDLQPVKLRALAVRTRMDSRPERRSEVRRLGAAQFMPPQPRPRSRNLFGEPQPRPAGENVFAR